MFEREKGIIAELDELSKQIRRCNQINEIVSQAGQRPRPEQATVLEEEVMVTKEGIVTSLSKLIIEEIQPS